eukprot:6176385-Pleurochrysis_carterae.AAC.1
MGATEFAAQEGRSIEIPTRCGGRVCLFLFRSYGLYTHYVASQLGVYSLEITKCRANMKDRAQRELQCRPPHRSILRVHDRPHRIEPSQKLSAVLER